jgi:predicted secreted hydrolase
MKGAFWFCWITPGLLGIGACIAAEPADWRRAAAGWKYEWPRDHGAHRDFKTEWWYFTGNLRAAGGRKFGYQLTFFRQGTRLPAAPPARSRFVVPDLKFGHFTITDVAKRRFLFSQELMRGAFGDAGFEDGARLAWLGGWSLAQETDGSFRIKASEPDRSLDLHLVPQKPWVVHGKDGVSIKAERPGHASHYYSGTRLRSSGRLTVEGSAFEVEGESWFDHEWATNQLAPDQAGWDWFSVQLDDGSELMLYRLRKNDGTIDAASSGTYVDASGATRHLAVNEMEVTATKRWRSARSGADYPIAWNVRIPSLQIDLVVSTPVENQELVLQPITYWEGLIDVTGSRIGRAVRGHGYLELTGYAGPVVGLSQPGR